MFEVTFAPGARADYEAALDWYAARSPQVAAGFEAEVERAAESLGRFPESFALTDDRHRVCPVRRCPYGLVYRYEAGRVRIVAVPHNRQAPRDWSGRA